MELTAFLLIIILALFLACLSVLLWKSLSEMRKSAQVYSTSSEMTMQVLSKAIALLASKDLSAYQGIQVMETEPEPTSPNSSSSIDDESELIVNTISNEEADRLFDKHMRGEVLTDAEQEKFQRVFID